MGSGGGGGLRTLGSQGGLGLGGGFGGLAGDFVGRRQTHEHLGRDVSGQSGQLGEALLALGQGLVGIALLAEPAAGSFAAVAQE